MKLLTAIIVVVILAMLGGATTTATADSNNENVTYQGKSIVWWASRAVQARKDANARAKTVKRLRKTINHNSTISECVTLATIAYPSFTKARAWKIIHRESWTSGKQYAKNKHSTASGLYQFLTSTFASTPYGKAGMSIWSPCASSLAAGWMHQHGRGGEWAY